MYMIFSNPTLQNHFNAAVAGSEEVGGWLICALEPNTWPGQFSWRKVKKTLELGDCPYFVEAFVLAPNSHDKPINNWNVWDYQKAAELADLTAGAYRGFPVHFHTHPNGNPEPSLPDIAFAGANCQLYATCSQFCVVTARPLRVWFYRLKWGNHAAPDTGYLATGEFISWRQAKMRRWLAADRNGRG